MPSGVYKRPRTQNVVMDPVPEWLPSEAINVILETGTRLLVDQMNNALRLLQSGNNAPTLDNNRRKPGQRVWTPEQRITASKRLRALGAKRKSTAAATTAKRHSYLVETADILKFGRDNGGVFDKVAFRDAHPGADLSRLGSLSRHGTLTRIGRTDRYKLAKGAR